MPHRIDVLTCELAALLPESDRPKLAELCRLIADRETNATTADLARAAARCQCADGAPCSVMDRLAVA